MAKTKAERLADIHTEALRDFDNIQTAMRDERIQCLEDRRFYSIAGAQWEGPLEEQFENKPRFEVNKIALSVMRIINEYRNNRITVDFVPKDGSTDVELASTCDALYRASEQDSGADEAYDNAFEEAVGGGFGAWRLRNIYVDEEDDESDEQKIVFEPIYDADSSVFFDLDAKRQDKGDATRCFVITSMTRESYKAKYDDDPLTGRSLSMTTNLTGQPRTLCMWLSITRWKRCAKLYAYSKTCLAKRPVTLGQTSIQTKASRLPCWLLDQSRSARSVLCARRSTSTHSRAVRS